MYINRLFSAFIVGFEANKRVFYFRRTAFCVDFYGKLYVLIKRIFMIIL